MFAYVSIRSIIHLNISTLISKTRRVVVKITMDIGVHQPRTSDGSSTTISINGDLILS